MQRFPRACLRPAAAPVGDGLVAAIDQIDRPGATIATTAGKELARFGTEPPIRWSPSGRYVAAGQQGLLWTADGEEVVFANGEFQHGLVQTSGGSWGWSPVSDCGLSIESTGALQVSAADSTQAAAVLLVRRAVESFSFSPDGSKLGILTRTGGRRGPASIWIADLASGRMDEVRRYTRTMCCITFGGWSPDGDDLLFWAAPGASVSADGWRLTSIDAARHFRIWGATLTRPEVLARCATRLLALIGGDRFGQRKNRVAVLEPGPEIAPLTPPARYESVSCAGHGQLLVATRGLRLALFEADGTFVRNLTEVDTGNGIVNETNAEWGPAGTGIFFVRSIHNTRQLSYLPEGGNEPRPILDNRLIETFPAHESFDWSATQPDGLPVGS